MTSPSPDRAVVAVAAVARNGVIGNGPDIPWHVPGEQARFKRLTMGGVLVMGRRTYESIGRPLPGRRTVVLSRGPGWAPAPEHADRVDVVGTPEEALEVAAGHPGTTFVAGGGEVYRLLWPWTTVLELTEIDLEPDGDVTFPEIGPGWVEVSREPHEGHSYVRWERTPDQEEHQ
ncbi:dihydrofolate reductase [Auraticoccus monumenti]|uniref:Dihydrofolate reductase n=1 Tax=Auraticoccus monumenti TaxID=675864 RepID=A0A1G6ZFR4_9ACTN|nr:dihydrofolate reductase [Auraticoccus monumenti]SDE01087.1 dihydrofolate reductase [Auraticoccus monumenti]